MKSEIYIRKLKYDEAKLKLMIELDSLYLKGIKKVYIIHGKGKGILKNMVHNYLQKQPFVEKFYEAPFFEGGAGVTIAILN